MTPTPEYIPISYEMYLHFENGEESFIIIIIIIIKEAYNKIIHIVKKDLSTEFICTVLTT